MTIASASSSSVQRARPAGGLEQAVATSRASSLPVSLRSAPGRGSSLSARSRLPSTKRRLVRYTVEPPTPTLSGDILIAHPRVRGQQDLRPLELPRRGSCPRSEAPKFIALVLGQHDTIAYIHRSLLVGGPVELTDESNVWQARTQLHTQARPVSGLHRRLHARQSQTARRMGDAATLRRDAAIRPPDDSRPGTSRLHSPPTRSTAQHRGPRPTREPTRLASLHPTGQNLCAEVLGVCRGP